MVGSTQPCPVCGEPMVGRKTSASSDKCRAVKRRQARAERDQRVRALLEAAVRALDVV